MKRAHLIYSLTLSHLILISNSPLSWSSEIPKHRTSVKIVKHPVQMLNPTRHSVQPDENLGTIESIRSTVVETRAQGNHLFRLYYERQDRRDPTSPMKLLGIEHFDQNTGKLKEFKHSFMLAGETQWTSWMPAEAKKQGHFSWPTEEEISREPERENLIPTEMEALDSALAEAQNHEEQKTINTIQSLDAAAGPEATNWAPGDYTWSYDPSKIKIWSGYLWDFTKDKMFRGYRTPDHPGDILTPSQNVTTSDYRTVENYYKGYVNDFSTYTASNSRWLSPLDKWGIWAQRRFHQSWWLAPAWEATNHHVNYAWGGYCNSSVVLPFLWQKPKHYVIDQDLLFDERDLVGLMQVASYRVDYYFWGNRYNGAPGEDIADPTPQFSINLLQVYLGQNHIPLLFDHEAGPAVGNLTALSATVHIEKTSDPLVRNATLSIVNVGNMEDNLLPATQTEEAKVPDWTWGTDTKVYPFTITLNPNGTLKSTQWVKNDYHPDFFWLPTGIQDYPPPHQKNPWVPLTYIRELVKKSL